MSQSYQPSFTRERAAAGNLVERRARFIVRTYNHLFLAILAFAAIEIALFKSGLAPIIAQAMVGTSWMLVLGGFMVVSWLASRVAHTSTSKPAQYAALGGFVVAEAIIFVPLLFIAQHYAPGAIQSAGIVTMVGFAGLTAIAFTTRKDFSFLGSFLRWGGLCALLLIGASILFGFKLGTFFSVGMVAFAGAAILYDTSNVLRHFPEDRYVGAALELFASVALMFWYVLRLFVAARD
ncbi:MAG: Bax inhibitor-1 family protein [Polyangiaceae bacterium]